MQKQAIGMIETIGLGTGIDAADAAVKSANVRLIGYEISNNNGCVVVKLEGDVGAVTAAVEAAKAAAIKGRGIHASIIIPRPAPNLDLLIENGDTVGCKRRVMGVEETRGVQVPPGAEQGTQEPMEERAAEQLGQEVVPEEATMQPEPEMGAEKITVQPEPETDTEGTQILKAQEPIRNKKKPSSTSHKKDTGTKTSAGPSGTKNKKTPGPTEENP